MERIKVKGKLEPEIKEEERLRKSKGGAGVLNQQKVAILGKAGRAVMLGAAFS